MSIECAFFGSLGRDAEAKTSKNGKPYLRLNVRVDDDNAATWVSVMTFDPDAIAMAGKLLKGVRLYVEGRLSLDEWTAQDGSKRYSLSVMSWHTRLAIGRNKTRRETPEPNNTSRPPASTDEPYDDPLPF
jgi:single-strand DNA-binding protein